MVATKSDLQDTAGSVQFCDRQIAGTMAIFHAGTEATVHMMKAAFQNEETEAILLVGASNEFNSRIGLLWK